MLLDITQLQVHKVVPSLSINLPQIVRASHQQPKLDVARIVRSQIPEI